MNLTNIIVNTILKQHLITAYNLNLAFKSLKSRIWNNKRKTIILKIYLAENYTTKNIKTIKYNNQIFQYYQLSKNCITPTTLIQLPEHLKLQFKVILINLSKDADTCVFFKNNLDYQLRLNLKIINKLSLDYFLSRIQPRDCPYNQLIRRFSNL